MNGFSKLSEIQNACIEKRRDPALTKEQVRNEIEKIIASLHPEPRIWQTYASAKRQLHRLVGWYSDYPYFATREDFEAVMTRVVIALDLNDSYGFGVGRNSELYVSFPSEIGMVRNDL